MGLDPRVIERFSSLICDGTYSWDDFVVEHGDSVDAEALANLQAVWALAEYHRTAGDQVEEWGHLKIISHLGTGAFGDVYQAWDTRLEREVALKLLRPLSGPQEELLHEGRLLAQIRHPNIVTVYGADEHDGMVGIWMELIRGRTLFEWVSDNGPLGPREAQGFAIDLCAAVAAVHAKGLLHRDIKAQNVMRAEGGGTFLMDFGLGVREAGSSAQAALAGTPLYMAPELLLQERSLHTAASDIYALGVVLFYLVTGTYPVRGSTLEEIRTTHAEGNCGTLLDLRPDLPQDYRSMVDKALDADPRRRFASVGAMEQALRNSRLAPLEARNRPEATHRPWPKTIITALLLLVASLVLISLGKMLPWQSTDLSQEPTTRGGSVDTRTTPGGPDAEQGCLPEAIQQVREGRHYWNNRTSPELAKTKASFEKALDLDENCASAHSGMADVYSTMVDYGHMDAPMGGLAMDHARRALELNSELAEVFASHGYAVSLFLRDWEEAERSFLRALELDPQYFRAHQWYAAMLAKRGRTKEAVERIKLGLEIEPLSAPLHTVAGWMLLFDDRYDEAIQHAERALDLAEHYSYASILLTRLHVLQGNVPQARQVFERTRGLLKEDESFYEDLLVGLIEHAAGNLPLAEAAAERLEVKQLAGQFGISYLASLYAVMGNKEKAFYWLQEAYEEGDASILFLKVAPYFESLRSDSRYQDLLVKLNLGVAKGGSH